MAWSQFDILYVSALCNSVILSFIFAMVAYITFRVHKIANETLPQMNTTWSNRLQREGDTASDQLQPLNNAPWLATPPDHIRLRIPYGLDTAV